MNAQLGYEVHYTDQHWMLDVFLRADAHGHGHPAKVTLTTLDGYRQPVTTTIAHPYSGAAQQTALPGEIIICDATGDCEAFATFGGDLHITYTPTVTTMRLTSPAPVVWLKDPHSVWANAYWGFEGLLARLHTAYHGMDQDYIDDVLAADPRQLYCAMLQAVCESVLNTPDRRRMASQWDQLRWARHEIRMLERSGDWCRGALESFYLVAAEVTG